MRKRVRLSATEVGLLQYIGRAGGAIRSFGQQVDKSPARDRLKRLRLIESRVHCGYSPLDGRAGAMRWHLTDQGRKVVEAGQCSA